MEGLGKIVGLDKSAGGFCLGKTVRQRGAKGKNCGCPGGVACLLCLCVCVCVCLCVCDVIYKAELVCMNMQGKENLTVFFCPRCW